MHHVNLRTKNFFITSSAILAAGLLTSSCEQKNTQEAKPNTNTTVQQQSASFVDFRDSDSGRNFVESVMARYSDGGGATIPATCGGVGPVAEKIVRIRIKNKFKNLNRDELVHVRQYTSNDQGSGPSATLDQPDPNGYGSARMTRLDLDLKPFYSNTTNAVRVKVIIRDQDLEFLDRNRGVTVNNDPDNNVCGYRYRLEDSDTEDGNLKRESISFFVKKNPNYNGPVHFNIHLAVTDTNHTSYSLPIVIDPIIKNDG